MTIPNINQKNNNDNNDVDMALSLGAKKLHEGRKFMYEEGEKYNNQFIDPETGLYKENLMESRICPVCNSDKHREIFFKKGGRYVACQKCGMIFLNPVFTDAALTEFYSGNLATQAGVVANESEFYEKIYSKGLTTILKYMQAGTILDIGCSSGFFLDLAKSSGWRTVGVELNKGEALIAQTKHEVYVDSIFSLNLDKKFDVITMWDVFEHIKNGNKMLQLLSEKYLNDNGVIFLQIPNGRSLAARVLQEKCKMFDGIEHTNLYDHETIKTIANSNGFGILHLETVISEIPIIANYLDYQDSYFGEASHNNKILGLIDEETLHKNLLGYKMQVVLRKH